MYSCRYCYISNMLYNAYWCHRLADEFSHYASWVLESILLCSRMYCGFSGVWCSLIWCMGTIISEVSAAPNLSEWKYIFTFCYYEEGYFWYTVCLIYSFHSSIIQNYFSHKFCKRCLWCTDIHTKTRETRSMTTTMTTTTTTLVVGLWWWWK
jgi:hypothetical protein